MSLPKHLHQVNHKDHNSCMAFCRIFLPININFVSQQHLLNPTICKTLCYVLWCDAGELKNAALVLSGVYNPCLCRIFLTMPLITMHSACFVFLFCFKVKHTLFKIRWYIKISVSKFTPFSPLTSLQSIIYFSDSSNS